ncbi:phosphate ABC transporter permease subunit PstC, partial [Aquitalea sp. S1-19]|nr:phosphate ABC transporter permease subunit PstC [Aquitalea sp. S1-19]
MEKYKNTSHLKRQMQIDALFRISTRFFAFFVLAMLLGILFSLLVGSLPALKHFGWGFLTSTEWDP